MTYTFPPTEGIPSIGMSPFSCGWSTCQRNVSKSSNNYQFTVYTSLFLLWMVFCVDFFRNFTLYLYSQIAMADTSTVVEALDAGFVPVSSNPQPCI